VNGLIKKGVHKVIKKGVHKVKKEHPGSKVFETLLKRVRRENKKLKEQEKDFRKYRNNTLNELFDYEYTCIKLTTQKKHLLEKLKKYKNGDIFNDNYIFCKFEKECEEFLLECERCEKYKQI
jgi:hypothetical protein